MVENEHRPLAGKNALVTGGGGGIGQRCAGWLLRDGASVTLMGRTENTLREAGEALAAEFGAASTIRYAVGSAGDPDDVEAAVAHAARDGGALDILVATVGGATTIGPIAMTPVEKFRETLEVNTIAPFVTIRHAIPALSAAGAASVVCVSSIVATMSAQFMVGYCASKAGVEGIVRAAANELAAAGIRVNAVRPGLVDVGAERLKGIIDDPEVLNRFLEQMPIARPGLPDDIAAGVRYLAGPESAWVTGQSIAIDGGNELRAYPDLEPVVRRRWGQDAVDAAMAGRMPAS